MHPGLWRGAASDYVLDVVSHGRQGLVLPCATTAHPALWRACSLVRSRSRFPLELPRLGYSPSCALTPRLVDGDRSRLAQNRSAVPSAAA